MQLNINKRFKECYEMRQRFFLQRKTPVIIRVDGSCFHTLTRKIKCKKPFDQNFSKAMENSAIKIFSKFDSIIAYSQSDEISILLLDNKKYDTEPFYGYEINKLTSISGSSATVGFNSIINCDAIFDSRAFNIPNEELINYFISRQLDCIRNARNLWAEITLSNKIGKKEAKKELFGLGSAKQIEKVEYECKTNFLDMPNRYINGFIIYKKEKEIFIDENIPKFSENKKYIQDIIDEYYLD